MAQARDVNPKFKKWPVLQKTRYSLERLYKVSEKIISGKLEME